MRGPNATSRAVFPGGKAALSLREDPGRGSAKKRSLGDEGRTGWPQDMTFRGILFRHSLYFSKRDVESLSTSMTHVMNVFIVGAVKTTVSDLFVRCEAVTLT